MWVEQTENLNRDNNYCILQAGLPESVIKVTDMSEACTCFAMQLFVDAVKYFSWYLSCALKKPTM